MLKIGCQTRLQEIYVSLAQYWIYVVLSFILQNSALLKPNRSTHTEILTPIRKCSFTSKLVYYHSHPSYTGYIVQASWTVSVIIMCEKFNIKNIFFINKIDIKCKFLFCHFSASMLTNSRQYK